MKNILVPIDGSKGSKLALEKAIEIGRVMDSQITVVNVISGLINNPYLIEQEYKVEISKVFSEQGEKVVDEALKLLEDYPGEVKKELRMGDPAEEIITLAENGHYDLLVMGNRGLNAFSRVMMGSVSNRVLNHVKISVLIVK